MEHVQVGEIELTLDYFKLGDDEKENLCIGIIECMLEMLDKNLPLYVSRFEMLKKLLESSVITNLSAENYEIVAILKHCDKILDEKTSE